MTTTAFRDFSSKKHLAKWHLAKWQDKKQRDQSIHIESNNALLGKGIAFIRSFCMGLTSVEGKKLEGLKSTAIDIITNGNKI